MQTNLLNRLWFNPYSLQYLVAGVDASPLLQEEVLPAGETLADTAGAAVGLARRALVLSGAQDK